VEPQLPRGGEPAGGGDAAQGEDTAGRARGQPYALRRARAARASPPTATGSTAVIRGAYSTSSCGLVDARSGQRGRVTDIADRTVTTARTSVGAA